LSSKNYKVKMLLCYEDAHEEILLDIIKRSLIAEVSNPIENTDEIKIGFTSNRSCLEIYEKSNSLSRVRAITNSYLYLIYTIEKTIDIINGIEQH